MRLVKLSAKQFPDEDELQKYFDNTLPKKEKGKFFFGNQIAAPGLDPDETILFSYRNKLRYVAKAETGRLENKDRGEGYYSNFIVIKMPVRKANISLKEVQRKLSAEAGLKKSLLHQGWTEIEDERAEKVIEDMLVAGASTSSAKIPTHKRRHFTCYWKNDTCERNVDYEGNLLDLTAGNDFLKSGVESGDSIYVITVRKGLLYLIGRLTVARICNRAEAQQLLGTDDLEDAKDHIIAASATPMRFEFKVPIGITKKLRFIKKSGAVEPPIFKKSGYLDQQTLRRVRKLSPESAHLLDKLLPSNETVSIATKGSPQLPVDLPEPPSRSETKISRINRDSILVRDLKRRYGFGCQVGGCNFRIELGSVPAYIEVHHIRPLGGVHAGLDIHANMLVLCPNHHAMFEFGIPHFLTAQTIEIAGVEYNLITKHELSPDSIQYYNTKLQNREV